ncbi:delta-aminolevulinic acid dehydratase [Paenibacillus chitinolyticus]|uniref:delta-aminolevulinic acid dehydratase n=1 Tax=Paenibacillus chitinolyticus TaxID=79263 RepID=UPI0035563193
MSKPVMNVALVCGPDCDMEVQAIRSTLEYLGARVFTYWIGRPNDLIDLLSGKDLYPNTDLILLCFHGDEGQFIMPELGESSYDPGEPKGNFGPEEIRRFAKLAGKTVIGNGCSLGELETAQAFLDSGCEVYIGPNDYPDGNDALMFVLRLFYDLIQNKRSVKEAFQNAKSLDAGMDMYQLYENSQQSSRK